MSAGTGDGRLRDKALHLDFKRDSNNGIPPGASPETTCGSWAGFKLSRYLMQFTGQALYGDWIERLFYNAMGANPDRTFQPFYELTENVPYWMYQNIQAA